MVRSVSDGVTSSDDFFLLPEGHQYKHFVEVTGVISKLDEEIVVLKAEISYVGASRAQWSFQVGQIREEKYFVLKKVQGRVQEHNVCTKFPSFPPLFDPLLK